MASTILLSIVGMLLVAAAILIYYSNSVPNGIFSNILDEIANFLAGPLHSTAQDQYMNTTISVKNTSIVTDLALTSDQQTKGLSGRENLSENQGMLFVSKTPGRYGFWMKSMKFPLDIFWLNTNRSVVYLKENLQPCLTILNCPTYLPDTDSLYVLETMAGFAQRHNITKGTHFNFRLPT
ncbi:MAG: DUF192 domain-containing protein [Nitrososphaeraceae archaeon]